MAPEMMAGMVAAGASQEPTLLRAHLANHTPYIFKNTGQKIFKNTWYTGCHCHARMRGLYMCLLRVLAW